MSGRAFSFHLGHHEWEGIQLVSRIKDIVQLSFTDRVLNNHFKRLSQ
jgi:hypothetical protein